MKRSIFSEEQVAYAPREVGAGTPVGDVWQLGVSKATFYTPGRERTPPPPTARGRKRKVEALSRHLTLVVAVATLSHADSTL